MSLEVYTGCQSLLLKLSQVHIHGLYPKKRLFSNKRTSVANTYFMEHVYHLLLCTKDNAIHLCHTSLVVEVVPFPLFVVHQVCLLPRDRLFSIYRQRGNRTGDCMPMLCHWLLFAASHWLRFPVPPLHVCLCKQGVQSANNIHFMTTPNSGLWQEMVM